MNFHTYVFSIVIFYIVLLVAKGSNLSDYVILKYRVTYICAHICAT